MSAVIADTGPIHYLVLIEQISLLPTLFEHVILPSTVRDEMLDSKTPAVVRRLITSPPSWLEILPDPPFKMEDLAELDRGERSAIELAVSLQTDLILIDDRAGVIAAKKKGC